MIDKLLTSNSISDFSGYSEDRSTRISTNLEEYRTLQTALVQRGVKMQHLWRLQAVDRLRGGCNDLGAA